MDKDVVPLVKRSVACLAYPSSGWICYYFIFWTLQGSSTDSSLFKKGWLYSTHWTSFIPRCNSIFHCRTCQLCDQGRSTMGTTAFSSHFSSYRRARNNFNLSWRISLYPEEYWHAILEGLLPSLNGIPDKHRLRWTAHGAQKGALKLLHLAHHYAQTP